MSEDCANSVAETNTAEIASTKEEPEALLLSAPIEESPVCEVKEETTVTTPTLSAVPTTTPQPQAKPVLEEDIIVILSSSNDEDEMANGGDSGRLPRAACVGAKAAMAQMSSSYNRRHTSNGSENGVINGQSHASPAPTISSAAVKRTLRELRDLKFRAPGRLNRDPGFRGRRRNFLYGRGLAGPVYMAPVYDTQGHLIETGEDLCDCLRDACPGCFFPCSNCSSIKCGLDCRANRTFRYTRDHGN